MKVSLFAGLVLLGLGAWFSFVEYNPGSTVHQFAFGCNLQIPEYLETYTRNFDKYCLHNTVLSSILLAIIGGAVFLIVKTLKK